MKKKTTRKIKKTVSKVQLKKEGDFNKLLLAATLFFLAIVLIFSFR
jgi:hypothetical protein